MSPSDIGAGIMLLAGVLTATGWLARKVYRAMKFGEVVAQLVGKPGEPTLRELVKADSDRLARVEKELHPNGGSSLRDDVRRGVVLAEDARTVAAEAKTAAVELGQRLEHVGETASQERIEIRDAMRSMREEIAEDAAQKTADAFELLAEHGGPDLRGHLPVVPHAHVIPTIHEPALTSLPIEIDGEGAT